MPRQCQVKIAAESIVINFQRNKSDPDADFVSLTASGTGRLGWNWSRPDRDAINWRPCRAAAGAADRNPADCFG
jgi:hypothetical protein